MTRSCAGAELGRHRAGRERPLKSLSMACLVALVALAAAGARSAQAAAAAAARGDAPAAGGGTAEAAAGEKDGGEGSLPEATVTVEPPRARIGDLVDLTVTASRAGEWTAEANPALRPGAELGPFLIEGVDGSTPGTVVITLSPNEVGDLVAPPFEIALRLAGGRLHRERVPSAGVSVASVVGEEDATLADLKPPAILKTAWPWRAIVLALLVLALVAVAAYGLARWLRRPRRPSARPEDVLPPGVTPYDWMRAELERLAAKGLVEAGEMRQFHIDLADLFRRYLELRFRIPAMESTTGEIELGMRQALLGEQLARLTSGMLERCDRVKFAKQRPPAEEAVETFEMARRALEMTAPPPAPASTLAGLFASTGEGEGSGRGAGGP